MGLSWASACVPFFPPLSSYCQAILTVATLSSLALPFCSPSMCPFSWANYEVTAKRGNWQKLVNIILEVSKEPLPYVLDACIGAVEPTSADTVLCEIRTWIQ